MADSNPCPRVWYAARLQASTGKPISVSDPTISMSRGGWLEAAEVPAIKQPIYWHFIHEYGKDAQERNEGKWPSA